MWDFFSLKASIFFSAKYKVWRPRHGSRLQYGQRDRCNWGGEGQAQGAGQCPQTPQESAGSQEQAQLIFFIWVNKRFATQTWVLGSIAPLLLHHTQPRVLCPGQGAIFPSSRGGSSHHTQLSQSPQGYHQSGFLCNMSRWISNSRNPVRANSLIYIFMAL